jgi:hypothetical protein
MSLRICGLPGCTREFEPYRPWQIYCSVRCRHKAQNAENPVHRRKWSPDGAARPSANARNAASNARNTHHPGLGSTPPPNDVPGGSQELFQPFSFDARHRARRLERPQREKDSGNWRGASGKRQATAAGPVRRPPTREQDHGESLAQGLIESMNIMVRRTCDWLNGPMA